MKAILEKKSLRMKILQIRKSLTEEFIAKNSSLIQQNLFKINAFKASQHVCGFYPIPGEPNIIPALELKQKEGATIYLPKFNSIIGKYQMVKLANFANLEKGKFGIMEPADSRQILDEQNTFEQLVWLVPGLAFTPNGQRIGFGKGIYDYLLRNTIHPKIGICFEFQIYDSIEEERHDVKMDFVVTDKNIFQIKNKK